MWEYTFWSSTEALFVLSLIAQAPNTVGRANYFSLNWKCNFWPPSCLKRRNQAFPFNDIVFSGRLSFQSCGCGAFLCFPLPGPIQLSISWHGPQNETSPNQKDLFLFIWFLRQRQRWSKAHWKKNAKSHYSKKSNCELLKMASKSDSEWDFAGHGMHGSNSHGRRKYWISGWIIAPHPRESP